MLGTDGDIKGHFVQLVVSPDPVRVRDGHERETDACGDLAPGPASRRSSSKALVERHGIERAIVHVAGWERPGGLPPIDPGLKRAISWARARGVDVRVARTVYPRLEPESLG